MIAVGATACQISAVPAWALARRRSVQVRPAPVTLLIDCEEAALGPSEPMKASSSSPGFAVVSAGETIVDAGELWRVVTVLSSESAGAEFVVTLRGEEGSLSFFAASVAMTV